MGHVSLVPKHFSMVVEFLSKDIYLHVHLFVTSEPTRTSESAKFFKIPSVFLLDCAL